METVPPAVPSRPASRVSRAVFPALGCLIFGFLLDSLAPFLPIYFFGYFSNDVGIWDLLWIFYPFCVLLFAFGSCLWKVVAIFRKPHTAVPGRRRLPVFVKVLAIMAGSATLIPYVSLLLNATGIVQDDACPFNRQRMERIIEQIRQQKFTDDQIFLADKDGSVEMLPLQVQNQDFGQRSELMVYEKEEFSATDDVVTSHPGKNVCWGRRTGDGKLSVTIVIVNDGIDGDEFGFAYSDTPLVKLKGAPGPYNSPLAVDLPGTLDVPMCRIDSHWWKVTALWPWS